MSNDMPLTPTFLRLIDALARKDAEDYLREQAASRQASQQDRTNHVPLLPSEQAA